MKASEVMEVVKMWFKVSNYDAFQEITINELKREAFARLMLAKHDFDRELNIDDCKHPCNPHHSLLEIFRHTDYVL